MEVRKLVAESVGTALLVFIAVGVATMSFGFGLAGDALVAGIVATSLAFGLVVLVLAYTLGPISGCHINPAVTLGFLLTRRVNLTEAAAYWVAQICGGIVGALGLWGVVNMTGVYESSMGLGANGYGSNSMVDLTLAGAITVEIVLTFLFVLVVLALTREGAPAQVAGVVIGLGLTLVHLIGIALTGTSVNPARSLGPALFAGGDALSQLWVFIVAPLGGALLAAGLCAYLFPSARPTTAADVAETPGPAPQPAAT